jgi:hypothetical protein
MAYSKGQIVNLEFLSVLKQINQRQYDVEKSKGNLVYLTHIAKICPSCREEGWIKLNHKIILKEETMDCTDGCNSNNFFLLPRKYLIEKNINDKLNEFVWLSPENKIYIADANPEKDNKKRTIGYYDPSTNEFTGNIGEIKSHLENLLQK